ncbi:MAG: right-handed parallel beta-helix repeat-containing protein [Desulfobacterales bacterium]|nr:right-handed parallel beta-helix repeat-containing protein [Desulfobacterales bacterium]
MRYYFDKFRKTILYTLLLIFINVGLLFATDYDWVGGDIGNPSDWSNINNWSPVGVPSSALDNAKIPSGVVYPPSINSSELCNNLIVNPSAQLDIQSGAILTVMGDCTVGNYGKINIYNGELKLNTGMTNDGELNLSDATVSSLASYQNINNNGAIHTFSGSTLSTFNDCIILNNASGIIFLEPNTTIHLNDTISSSVYVSNNGSIVGNGTLKLYGTGGAALNLQNYGTINPGPMLDTVGMLTIEGNYYHNTGKIHIDIAGTIPGTEYDVVSISGTAYISGGDLDVAADPVYIAANGDTFNVISYTYATSPYFNAVALPSISGFIWDPITYTASSIMLTIKSNSTAPNPPIVTCPTVSNNPKPTWTWTSGGGGNGTFRYQLDSETGVGTETTQMQYIQPYAFNDGEIHTLYVQEKDDAGNWSGSGSFSIRIDISSANPPVVTGNSPTNNIKPTWTWTSDGGGNGEFRYQLDSEIETGWIGTANLSYTPSNPFGDGESHTLYVQEKSSSGLWSSSGYFTILIDTTPPNAPVITTDGGKGEGNDFKSAVSSVTLNGTCSNDTEAIYVNGSINGVSYSKGDSFWTYTGQLMPDVNLFSITAYDLAGNISAPDEINITFVLYKNEYYIDINLGSDDLEHGLTAGSGSWKTLHYAISQLSQANWTDYTIHIADGTYNVSNGEPDEELIITNENLKIIGVSDSGIIINGLNSNNWIYGILIDASNVSIKNIAVTGFYGIGIKIQGSSNKIESCRINQNGIGIFIDSVSSTNIIQNNCKIYNNSYKGISIYGSNNQIINNNGSIYDNGSVTDRGIGIEISEGASNNLVNDNSIYWSGDTNHHQGFGILFINAGSNNAIIQNNIYGHNGSEDYGISIINASPDISQNRIYDNFKGIYVYADINSASSPSIWNNVIYGTGSLQHYGVYLYNSGGIMEPSIYHNTIHNGLYYGIGLDGGAKALIKYNIITNFEYGIINISDSPEFGVINYNDVWNNVTENYSNCNHNGNDISVDPKLNSDFSLTKVSPCVDAIPLAEGDIVPYDIISTKRPKDGNGDGLATHDIGAYELNIQGYALNLIGGNGDIADYRIITLPVDIGNGSKMLAEMENQLGVYDPRFWRIFAWTGGSDYLEITDDSFKALAIKSGIAFWAISRSNSVVTFEGSPANNETYFEININSGWNLIANPWINTNINVGKIAVTNGTNTYFVNGSENSLTDQWMWDYTGNGAYSGYDKLENDADLIQYGKGYWIKANLACKMLIPPDNTGVYFSPVGSSLKISHVKRNENVEIPPMPPGGNGVASGGSGCFIDTMFK